MRQSRIALAALVAVLAACGSPELARSTQRERLLIGIIGRFEAPELARSAGIAKGVEVAIRQYNAKPDSTYRFAATQSDTKGSDETVAKAAEDLVANNRVIGVIGPFEEGHVPTAGEIFEREEMPFLVPSVASTTVPAPNWRSFRRLIASDHREGRLMVRTLPGRGPVAILHDGTPAGAAFAEGAKAGLEAAKRPLLRMEGVSQRSNLNAIVNAISSDKPEGVMFGGDSRQMMNLIAAIGRSGYKGAQASSHHMRAGKPPAGTANGMFSSAPSPDARDDRMRSFSSSFRSNFSSTPPPFAIEGYEGALMLLEAIEEVEAKPREVSEFLRLNRSFRGDSKNYEFSVAGEVMTAPVWIYQLRGNAWAFLNPVP